MRRDLRRLWAEVDRLMSELYDTTTISKRCELIELIDDLHEEIYEMREV